MAGSSKDDEPLLSEGARPESWRTILGWVMAQAGLERVEIRGADVQRFMREGVEAAPAEPRDPFRMVIVLSRKGPPAEEA